MKKDEGILENAMIRLGEEKNRFMEEHIKEMMLYKGILETYKNIGQELKLSTALEFSYYYTYLLWNGYFSATKKHEYNSNDRSMVFTFPAADVIKGGGVCLEYSAVLSDFLKICDKEATAMFCYLSQKKGEIKFDYTPNMERNINKQDATLRILLTKVLTGIGKKVGNHAVTVVNENGQQYVFDATNLAVLNIENNLRASLINGNGYFDLKKYSLNLFNSIDDDSELIYKLKNETAYSDLRRKDVITGYENTLELVKKNKSLIEEGYDSIHSSIEEIHSKVLSMKK